MDFDKAKALWGVIQEYSVEAFKKSPARRFVKEFFEQPYSPEDTDRGMERLYDVRDTVQRELDRDMKTVQEFNELRSRMTFTTESQQEFEDAQARIEKNQRKKEYFENAIKNAQQDLERQEKDGKRRREQDIALENEVDTQSSLLDYYGGGWRA